eukprot:2043665-Prymnesium_polylepis.1
MQGVTSWLPQQVGDKAAGRASDLTLSMLKPNGSTSVRNSRSMYWRSKSEWRRIKSPVERRET